MPDGGLRDSHRRDQTLVHACPRHDVGQVRKDAWVRVEQFSVTNFRSILKAEKLLMVRAYRAVRALRELLALHPDLSGYDGVPDWLEKGEIYTF
jgi:hypothetical protein